MATPVHLRGTKILRILLVDKHPLIASGIAALISVREGWHFKSVFSAKVGIAELEEFAPDIAIIEIHLSDDPGLELLKQASTWPHRTRCMVLTSSNDPVVAAIALDLGAKAFFQQVRRSATATRSHRYNRRRGHLAAAGLGAGCRATAHKHRWQELSTEQTGIQDLTLSCAR